MGEKQSNAWYVYFRTENVSEWRCIAFNIAKQIPLESIGGNSAL